MVRLNNWLSPDVLHALGWALVHSLWQCLAVAALVVLGGYRVIPGPATGPAAFDPTERA